MGGRDVLYLTGVTARLPRKAIDHAIARQPISSSPTAAETGDDVVSYGLTAAAGGAPRMICEVISRDNGRQVMILVEAASRLPELSLTAVLPADIHPARYRTPQGPYAIQLAVGPATRLVFDSLQDTVGKRHITYSGQVTFEAASSGYSLRTLTGATPNKRIVLLRLELQAAEEPEPRRGESSASLAQLAPPVSLKEARRRASEWAFLPAAERATIPSLEQAMSRLSIDRIELLRRIRASLPVRSVDRAGDATRWNLAIAGPREQWNVLCLRNPAPIGKTEPVSLKGLGITASAGCRLAVYDFWQQQLVAITDDAFEIDVPAGDCRVLCVRDVRPSEPCLLSSSRDITQGLYGLADVIYDAKAMTLSGHSELIPGDPCELRLLLPVGPNSLEIGSIEAAASWQVRSDGPLRIVSFESNTEQIVAWKMAFRKAASRVTKPPPPARMASQQNTRGVLLTWDVGESRPARYRIYRDRKPLATVAGSENEYQDSTAVYNASYPYTIRSVDWLGRESEPLPPLVHRTPIPADAYLTQLVPLAVTQGPAPISNRSVGGNPLRMAGRRYNRGLGTVPGTQIEYFLGKGYGKFSGEVGIDDDTTAKGQAQFEIRADGRMLFRSEPLAAGQRPQRFDVSLTGAQTLTLTVIAVEGGGAGLHADWGDTYLRAAPSPGR